MYNIFVTNLTQRNFFEFTKNWKPLYSRYLLEHDTTGLDIRFATPVEAMKETCQRARGVIQEDFRNNTLKDKSCP
jgi:monomeric isocitrate dehydrogenase